MPRPEFRRRRSLVRHLVSPWVMVYACDLAGPEQGDAIQRADVVKLQTG